MGNNKKTVKCSFCSRLGHNRVSCPNLKERIEIEREKYGSDHPDVKTYDQLVKGYSKKSSNNANKERHCKYCHYPNHNVRSCAERSRDISDLKKRNASWRKALLEFFEERGIGTGCILTSKFSNRYGSRMYNKGDRWILTSIDWDKITFDCSSSDPDDQKIFKLVNLANSMVTTSLSVSQFVAVDDSSSQIEFHWDVVSPSKTLDFPKDWDSVKDRAYDEHLVELFKGMNKRGYEDLISFSYGDKSFIILKRIEEMLGESLSVSLTYRG